MPTEYGWLKIYHDALLETDWSKIEEKIEAAENAIGDEVARILHEPRRDARRKPSCRGGSNTRLDALRNEVANGRNRNGRVSWSTQFVQFPAEIAEALIPFGVSVNFFWGHWPGESRCVVQQCSLLIHKR